MRKTFWLKPFFPLVLFGLDSVFRFCYSFLEIFLTFNPLPIESSKSHYNIKSDGDQDHKKNPPSPETNFRKLCELNFPKQEIEGLQLAYRTLIGNVRQDFIAKTFKKTETDEQQIIEFLFDNANSPITTNSIEDKTGVPKRQHARIFEQLQTKIERYNGLQSSVRLVLIRKRNRDKINRIMVTLDCWWSWK